MRDGKGSGKKNKTWVRVGGSEVRGRRKTGRIMNGDYQGKQGGGGEKSEGEKEGWNEDISYLIVVSGKI